MTPEQKKYILESISRIMGINQFDINIDIKSDGNLININENVNFLTFEDMLIQRNKLDNYKNFLAKFDSHNAQTIDEWINSLSFDEWTKFCDSLYIFDDNTPNKDIVNHIFSEPFLCNTMLRYEPSSMHGSGEVLFLYLLPNCVKHPFDILFKNKGANIKKANITETIRTAIEGNVSSFPFWTYGIVPTLNMIVNDPDNLFEGVTDNQMLLISKASIYFKSRTNNNGQYRWNTGEFNKTDFEMFKTISSFITTEGYDFSNLESDIQSAVDVVSGDKIIQITNSNIFFFEKYKFSHITQGRIRPVLDI